MHKIKMADLTLEIEKKDERECKNTPHPVHNVKYRRPVTQKNEGAQWCAIW